MLRRKFNTMVAGIREQGLFRFFRLFLFERDSDVVGRFVEFTGNRVRIEGLKISVDSPAVPTINKSQFLQGRYEQAERTAVKRYLDKTIPVIELGGSVGVVACMTNRLLEPNIQHIVVEANPAMTKILEKNRSLNNCTFSIVNRAIGYHDEEIRFYQYGFSSSIRVVSEDYISVPTITLKEVIDQFHLTRVTLICDIEGAEVDLVREEIEILKNHVSTIIAELHPDITSPQEVEFVRSELQQAGFAEIFVEHPVYVYKNQIDS
jgi:FkbM family methyltransferase